MSWLVLGSFLSPALLGAVFSLVCGVMLFIAVEELIIPEQFDETYSQYLELQASQGFDLTDYCGKRVKRYTYEITNYPTGESGIQAGLLVYKSTVIGGDVLSAQLGGFIPGLEMPA